MEESGELEDGKIRLLRSRAVQEECIRVNLQGEGAVCGQPCRRVSQPRQGLRDRRVPVGIERNRAGRGLARTRELAQARRDVRG